MTRKIKIRMPKKNCFLCYNLPLEEFTQEIIKKCAEHWMNAENCSNWEPIIVYIGNKKVVWIEN